MNYMLFTLSLFLLVLLENYVLSFSGSTGLEELARGNLKGNIQNLGLLILKKNVHVFFIFFDCVSWFQSKLNYVALIILFG